MAVKESFTCDICGTERKETNHWFAVRFDSTGTLIMQTWERAKGGEHLGGEETHHLCGQACVHKFIDKWLSNPAVAA